MAWDGPKWGREDFFPAKPDLADILDNMDLDFENSLFVDFKFLDFQVPKFPKSGPGPGLGWAFMCQLVMDVQCCAEARRQRCPST